MIGTDIRRNCKPYNGKEVFIMNTLGTLKIVGACLSLAGAAITGSVSLATAIQEKQDQEENNQDQSEED